MSFYTDVIMKDRRFSNPARCNDVLLLDPLTRDAVFNVLAEAAKAGMPLVVFETFRSQARQAALFAQGATQLRTVGVHHTGLAADLVRLVDKQPSWKVDYSFLGPLARKHGLIWGGDWAGFRDMDHVQRLAVSDQDRVFAGTFYPDGAYDPYQPPVYA